ncbi:HAMP domain-containing histidine kinase [Diaphorobacter sp. HDW4A]|uniref:sensor histidine kinase n=1 Tax=Diaphorobacter sp. HDW4A TaxID=2714924 RepID=UPI001408DF60|nr:HAMP domain-containing sensor histidine kinase [Diaphorobacter sp. HDW4A]QIL78516.1 HAMP domain-containing histidine kinase [Diaphorobacter sp. HDW4A]
MESLAVPPPILDTRRARRRWVLLLGIALLFFAFSVAVAWQLVVLYGKLNIREAKNTLWSLSQAQNHGTQLERDDERFRQGLISRDELSLQEDLFFSRLTVLKDGPQKRLLEHFDHEHAVLAAVDHFLAVDTGSIVDQPRDSDVHRALSALTRALAAAGNQVMVVERDERSQQLEQIGELIRAAFAAFSVVLLTGGVLVWQLLKSHSHQRKQLRIIAEQRDTLQLTVHQLHQAQLATETYRNFVSLVSHQFRTPLAVIDSTAQRLMRTARSAPDSGFADSELVLEKMNLTRSTVEHLNKLIDSVLTSVRLDSGAVRLQAQPLNMAELMGRVIATNAHLLHERPLLMETEGNAHDYVCMGDPNLLEHVLQNLLSNACKYTESGTAISVSLARAGDRHIVCTVRDWGDGVSEAELPLLFERFFRSEQARSADGTGLGLYLARSIAQLHGGDMHASLAEGGGLAVHLRIPASR